MKMVKKNIHISMNTRVIVNNSSKIISSSLVKGKQMEDTKVIQKRQIKPYREKWRIRYFKKNKLLFCISKKYYVIMGAYVNLLPYSGFVKEGWGTAACSSLSTAVNWFTSLGVQIPTLPIRLNHNMCWHNEFLINFFRLIKIKESCLLHKHST